MKATGGKSVVKITFNDVIFWAVIASNGFFYFNTISISFLNLYPFFYFAFFLLKRI